MFCSYSLQWGSDTTIGLAHRGYYGGKHEGTSTPVPKTFPPHSQNMASSLLNLFITSSGDLPSC